MEYFKQNNLTYCLGHYYYYRTPIEHAWYIMDWRSYPPLATVQIAWNEIPRELNFNFYCQIFVYFLTIYNTSLPVTIIIQGKSMETDPTPCVTKLICSRSISICFEDTGNSPFHHLFLSKVSVFYKTRYAMTRLYD